MENNPLWNTVCVQLMIAGIRGVEDTDPPCMGDKCSCFLVCQHSIYEAQEGIAKMQKRARRSRP